MGIKAKLRHTVSEAQRVLRVTKKPTKVELINTIKVSAIGIALIGTIGFALHMVSRLVFR
jgi:protein transport protein SEC61 subunit gamma and related proteins